MDIDKPASLDDIASSEVAVHREIYQYTPVIHAHPPFAVIESLLVKKRLFR